MACGYHGESLPKAGNLDTPPPATLAAESQDGGGIAREAGLGFCCLLTHCSFSSTLWSYYFVVFRHLISPVVSPLWIIYLFFLMVSEILFNVVYNVHQVFSLVVLGTYFRLYSNSERFSAIIFLIIASDFFPTILPFANSIKYIMELLILLSILFNFSFIFPALFCFLCFHSRWSPQIPLRIS